MLREVERNIERTAGELPRRTGTSPRTASAVLGVSEAELLAARCGESVTRLAADWAPLLSALPALGPVVAVTRNARAVHERRGCYGNVRILGSAGVVLNGNIDLRLHLDHWHVGFAVREARRLSLEFFGRDGSPVHKVFLTAGSDVPAYEDLVRRYTSPDQSPAQRIGARAVRAPERPDWQVSLGAFRGAWSAPEETHDLHPLLKSFGVSRPQALRLAGNDFAHRVARTAAIHVLGRVAASGTPIMVLVGNPGTMQIHTGPIRRVIVGPHWIRVRDADFNLRIRVDRIQSAWVVKKPTRDGGVSSLELFDPSGETIALLYGERIPGQPDLPGWRATLSKLPVVEPVD